MNPDNEHRPDHRHNSSPQESSRHELLRQDGQLLQIVDAAFADAARRSGRHLLCHPGCTQCCYGAFAIGPLDALRLRAGMDELRHSDAARAAKVEERARLYLAQYGPSFPGDLSTGILYSDQAAQGAFESFANEAPCPALDEASGRCDLYGARPMTCRIFGPPVRTEIDAATEIGTPSDNSSDTPSDNSPAQDESNPAQDAGLAVCELCFTQATPEEIIACEMHLPHEQENRLIEKLEIAEPALAGDTIVAFCLIAPTAS